MSFTLSFLQVLLNFVICLELIWCENIAKYRAKLSSDSVFSDRVQCSHSDLRVVKGRKKTHYEYILGHYEYALKRK